MGSEFVAGGVDPKAEDVATSTALNHRIFARHASDTIRGGQDSGQSRVPLALIHAQCSL